MIYAGKLSWYFFAKLLIYRFHLFGPDTAFIDIILRCHSLT